jgi:3-oxoacyl-[acyl-carrier protein] reductase
MLPEGSVALVTGAGRGIGRQVALDFAHAGVAVGLLARSTSQLEEVAALIKSGGGAIGCGERRRDQPFCG